MSDDRIKRELPTEKVEPDDGVDSSLIRWCLSLSPQERLEVLQANLNAIVKLRDVSRAGG